MKIINETAWRTDQIRAIIKRVAAEEFDGRDRKTRRIYIRYRTRHQHVGGLGTLGHSSARPAWTSWIFVHHPDYYRKSLNAACGAPGCNALARIHQDGWREHFAAYARAHCSENLEWHAFVPRSPEVPGPEFAFVVAHEFQHNKGRRHSEMARRYLNHDYAPWSWANNIEPEQQITKPKPSRVEAFEQRLQHAAAMEKVAATRAKRATTILKKWTNKIRRYEKQLAALKPRPA